MARPCFGLSGLLLIGHGVHFLQSTSALLGTKGQNQTEKPVRVVGYRIDRTDYFVATDRFDLSAADVALAYKLRWDIEIFFGWWKQHLNVYHLIARTGGNADLPQNSLKARAPRNALIITAEVISHNHFPTTRPEKRFSSPISQHRTRVTGLQ
jgi:hypothetical protein